MQRKANQYQACFNLFVSFSLSWFLSELYCEENLPTHPCLNLIANSEQVLSAYVSRRLLTYEKVSVPENSEVSASIFYKLSLKLCTFPHCVSSHLCIVLFMSCNVFRLVTEPSHQIWKTSGSSTFIIVRNLVKRAVRKILALADSLALSFVIG